MTDKTILPNPKSRSTVIDLNHLLLIALYVCAFFAFLSKDLWIFTGPVMAVLCVYLYFKGFAEYVTALIVIANDAMGTIFLGSVSFPYLLIVLALIRFVLVKRRISIQEIVFFAVSLLLLIELMAVELIDGRAVFYSMTYIVGFLALSRGDEWTHRLLRGITVAVALISLHAVVTGGVPYVEIDVSGSSSIISVIRYGVLGTGNGDPNFSAFLINVGLACTLGDPKLRWLTKLLLSLLYFFALGVTVSISGLLAAACILIIFLLLRNKPSKGLLILCISIFALIVAFQLYINLPDTMRNATIDGYILRIEEALGMASDGDISGATTNRSEILLGYIYYIFDQPILGLLFGGNSLKVDGRGMPHNTFIGIILQIGCIGFLCLMFWMGLQVFQNIKKPKDDLCRKQNLLLKALCIFMAFTLSFYQGSLWALWMFFIFLL